MKKNIANLFHVTVINNITIIKHFHFHILYFYIKFCRPLKVNSKITHITLATWTSVHLS